MCATIAPVMTAKEGPLADEAGAVTKMPSVLTAIGVTVKEDGHNHHRNEAEAFKDDYLRGGHHWEDRYLDEHHKG